MATITFPSPYPPQAVTVPSVYTRVLWNDAWTSACYLWPLRVALSTGETISSATFHWGFGQYLAPGGVGFASVPVLAVNPRSFVRVVAGGFAWQGIWQRADKRDTTQELSAVGLEQLLDVPCLDLPFWDGSSVCWSGRGLGFNVGGPNRGPQKSVNGQTVYVFSNDPLCTDYWSTRDAVQLLLAAACPKDENGNKIFDWEPQNTSALPDFDRPELPTHGRTGLELLRSLVPRYRLIGWMCEPGTGSNVAIRFFTFADGAVTLTDAQGNTVGTIPANNTQDALIFTYDQSSAASLVTEASHVADQVIVRGDRRKIVFSLSNMDGTLDKKWIQTRENAYVAGASGALDYPAATEIRLREERDRDARNVDELRSVFAWYGPVQDWDQTAGDGEDGEDLEPIAVDEDDNPFPLHVPSLAFQSQVPREIDEDRYDEDLPLLSFVRIVYATSDPDGKNRWVFGDQVGRAADLEQQQDNKARRWSLSVRPVAEVVSSALWLELRVNQGEQHVLAADEFSGQDDAIEGDVDWQQDVIVTVCIEDTRNLEARYPADADLDSIGHIVNRMWLDAPGYRYVDLRPHTVIGVDDSQQLIRACSAGEIVVDDTDDLLLIAQRTYQWHALPRYALGFSSGWIDASCQIGHLITTMTDATATYPVRSVITEITLEFPISQSTTPQRPIMSLTTAFAEMDAQLVV